MSDSSKYERRGVSATKSEVHAAIQGLDQGLYPKAFCKILPDFAAGDPAYCNLMHADTAGTKPSLAYLYWKETGDLSVPLPLRNAPTKLMKDIGYGAHYQYAHDFEDNFIDQEFLPEELSSTKFYEPGDNSREATFRAFLKKRWKKKYDY